MRRGRLGIPRGRASDLTLAALALVAPTQPFALHAQKPPAPADSVRALTAGSGDSYWGPIGPGTDSTTATLTNRPMPVWEGMLYWPYRVITYPIKLVGMGIGAGIAYVDEHRILAFLFRPPGVLRIEPDITAGGLSGFGGGLAVRHTAFFGEGNELKARVYATVNGDQKFTLGLKFPVAAVGELQFGAGFRDRDMLHPQTWFCLCLDQRFHHIAHEISFRIMPNSRPVCAKASTTWSISLLL